MLTQAIARNTQAITNKADFNFFSLLIDGKDVDTGIYEYFPYADKMIVDYRSVYKTIALIKKGTTSANASDYIYAKYCIGDENTNARAIQAAYDASKIFRLFPVSIRRKILGDIHRNLLARKKELLDIFVVEGHPRKLAEWEFSGMEKAYRPESLDYFKDELWTEIGRKDNETMYLVRKPDGVVCISPPKNAPCSNSLTAGFALLGGNTLVVKPPLRSPLSTIFLWKEIVWKAARDHGAPCGTINIVIGNSKVISDEWIASPFVNDIIYFGTSEKGLEMGKRIYLAGKKPILELSGNDMMFIWKDANLEHSVEALSDAFLGSTQICMVPKAAFIHEAIFNTFVDCFAARLKKMKVGLPSDPATCLIPVMMIKEFYFFLEDAISKGARLLQGGQRVDYTGKEDKNGSYIVPALLLVEECENPLSMTCVKEENFFPLLPLVRVSGKSDQEIFSKMVNIANSNEYGLRTSVWVRSGLFTRKFIRHIYNSGLLRINSRHVDFSLYLSTHGGTGKTGGPYGEMNYLWQKTTHLQGISLTREKIPGPE